MSVIESRDVEALREPEVQSFTKDWFQSILDSHRGDSEMLIETEKPIVSELFGTGRKKVLAMPDIHIKIEYQNGVSDIWVECKGWSARRELYKMQRALGQALIYKVSGGETVLSVPHAWIDRRLVASCKLARIGLLGITIHGKVVVEMSSGPLMDGFITEKMS